MSSLQCLQESRIEQHVVNRTLCLPTAEETAAMARRAVEHVGAQSIFIGTDADDFADQISRAVNEGRPRHSRIPIVRYQTNDKIADLVAFIEADLFVANCVSSFSAFAVRARSIEGRGTTFFGFEDWSALPPGLLEGRPQPWMALDPVSPDGEAHDEL